MSKEIIKSIEIEIGDTTVKISPKQARALFEALRILIWSEKHRPFGIPTPCKPL